MMDLSAGLEAGHRFRCTTCGNLTRFDVVVTERARRYHHFSLGGERTVPEEEILARTVEKVTCRWCQTGEVVAETAPLVDPGADPVASSDT